MPTALLLMVVHGIVCSLRIFLLKLPFIQFAAAGTIVLWYAHFGAADVRLAIVRTETVDADKLCRLINGIK